MTTRNYDLTDADDSARRILSIGREGESITTFFRPDSVYALNKEERKDDGFMYLPGLGRVRRVAHIDMNTVKLLAVSHDVDAEGYLKGDTDARDRMIRRYPHLFKACSGGI